MELAEPTDVRALIRAARETKMEISAVDPDSDEATDAPAVPSDDPRFVAPGRRRSVPEDSGTYSVVFRREG